MRDMVDMSVQVRTWTLEAGWREPRRGKFRENGLLARAPNFC